MNTFRGGMAMLACAYMGPQPKVLIADPDLDAASSIAKLLQSSNLLTAAAGDGTVALAAAQQVDLALLDLDLPGNGLEVLRKLREGDQRRHLPVMLTSAKPNHEAKLKAFELGADDWLEKPFDGAELLARVHRLLDLRRRIDQLIAERAELERISLTDSLTQLHNHRFFQERLEEEFRRAQRYDDPVSLVLADLDHFKSINDRYGHLVGDQVLRDVAQVLKKSTRETDLLARYGGEEFAVILPKTHLSGSLTVAERVMKDLATLRAGPAGVIRVTASLGVSGYPNRSIISAEQLLLAADEALYRAKREGRNRICLHQQRSVYSDPEMKLA
ncbi:MAG TPA: diguanylate cyclase [Myxococcaceae bacterium]|nr:diguanylate cyclase [Myxococcaceae bacterium]